MTIDSSEEGSAADATEVGGPRNTRNECSDIFSEHFISLRVDLSPTFSTVSSVRGARVQYSTWRSSASGVDSSPVTGIDELQSNKSQFLCKQYIDSCQHRGNNSYIGINVAVSCSGFVCSAVGYKFACFSFTRHSSQPVPVFILSYERETVQQLRAK